MGSDLMEIVSLYRRGRHIAFMSRKKKAKGEEKLKEEKNEKDKIERKKRKKRTDGQNE